MKRDKGRDYKKINEMCELLIANLSDELKNKNDSIKFWKDGDSVVEVLSKISSILERINKVDHSEDADDDKLIISDNDKKIIEKFVKNLNKQDIPSGMN